MTITSIEINAPIDKVVALYINKDNFKVWKKGMIDYEPVSGVPGTVGAVTRLLFKNGGILNETITVNNLPDAITADYEHSRSKMVHTSTHRFTALATDKTLVTAEMKVTKYAGLFSRILILLLYRTSKRYSEDQLRLFRALAEQTPQ